MKLSCEFSVHAEKSAYDLSLVTRSLQLLTCELSLFARSLQFVACNLRFATCHFSPVACDLQLVSLNRLTNLRRQLPKGSGVRHG